MYVLFDFLLYPTVSVIINKLTKNDKPLVIIYKIILFIFPMFLIELWAEKKTNLIRWRRPWKWYHTLLSLTVKSVLNRLMIGAIRALDEKVEKSS
ncbi:CBO0543 family protein [Priestia megaterium]|uniref:CBO0543 family protein n=1 Tax=Priestia megaterium TaxID=1404 RepID=UPI0031FBDA33